MFQVSSMFTDEDSKANKLEQVQAIYNGMTNISASVPSMANAGQVFEAVQVILCLLAELNDVRGDDFEKFSTTVLEDMLHVRKIYIE